MQECPACSVSEYTQDPATSYRLHYYQPGPWSHDLYPNYHSVLMTGLHAFCLVPLFLILHTFKNIKSNHVSPVLITLQWCPISLRVGTQALAVARKASLAPPNDVSFSAPPSHHCSRTGHVPHMPGTLPTRISTPGGHVTCSLISSRSLLSCFPDLSV